MVVAGDTLSAIAQANNVSLSGLEAANPAIPDPDLSKSATDARCQHETFASACICAELRPEPQFAQALRSTDGALLLCIEQSRLGRASTYRRAMAAAAAAALLL